MQKKNILCLFLAICFSTLFFIFCSKLKERSPVAPSIRLTYEKNIKIIFDTHCILCHGGSDTLAGNYELTNYIGILGSGTSDVPNAIAGDAFSLLVLKISPDSAHFSCIGAVQNGSNRSGLPEGSLFLFSAQIPEVFFHYLQLRSLHHLYR